MLWIYNGFHTGIYDKPRDKQIWTVLTPKILTENDFPIPYPLRF